MAAYEVLLLNTAIPQIQAAQSGDTYVVPRDIAFSAAAFLANGTSSAPSLAFSSDTDTGIFRPGTNSLAFAVGAAQAMTLDASGNLVVGGTSALGSNASRGNITVNGATDSILSFGNAASLAGYILQDSGGMTIYSSGATYQRFYTNNTERARITSGGDVEVTTGNLVIKTSGQGIDFSATAGPTNGTMTSELLSDYEEGTWTPGFGTGWTTAPSVATTGTYVKIGKQVTVSVYLLDGVSTAGALITGLPFTVGVESSMTGFSGTTSTAPLMTGVTQGGTTQIRSIPAATMTGLYWTVSTTYFV